MFLGQALQREGLGIFDPEALARHGGLLDVPEAERRGRRAILSVRDPWAWHVSFYHFTANGDGREASCIQGLFELAIGHAPSFDEYIRLATDLRGVPYSGDLHFGWPLPEDAVPLREWAGPSGAGLLTAFCARLVSLRREELLRRAEPPEPEDFDALPVDATAPETVEIALHGICAPGLAARLRDSAAVNGGSYAGGSRSHYTEETAGLVARAEAGIIRCMGYRF